MRPLHLLCIFLLSAQSVFAQFNKRYEDITSKDLIQALQFAGVDIFKFDVNSNNKNYDFFLVVDEYDSTQGLRRIDTLLTLETQYQMYSDKRELVTKFIDQFRFLTKVLNNDYGTIYLFVSMNYGSTWQELYIAPQYARKHYWVRFADQPTIAGKVIPLLFYGSEWDDIINGVKVPRYCSVDELKPELQDPTIKLIPHYFIISYVFQERQ